MVKVGVEGVAKDITVFESSGVRSIDVAAIEAAYKWHYFPAVKDDRPVEGYAKIPISFAGNPVQKTVDRSIRKKFVTRNDAVFGEYAKAAEARILAKGNELYPDDARKNHWYGSVVTTTCIRRDGGVANVNVLKSSGIERLDRSIVESTKAAAPFNKLIVNSDGPDQLCITTTYEYAHGSD
jgi:TonB family protein